jgi:hypothetical protein
MTYEVFKTLNLDTLEDRNTKVHHNVIVELFGLYFELQWKHKRKAMSSNDQWKQHKKNLNVPSKEN